MARPPRTARRRRVGGLPRIRFHDLRHTAATLMLSRGVHPKIVAERLGHSTPMLTLTVYSHVTPTMQREAAANARQSLGRLKETAEQFRERRLRVSLDFARHDVGGWQGTALVGLPERGEVLLSLPTRSESVADLRRIRLSDNSEQTVRGIGGELRHALTDGEHLWVLAMYRLHHMTVDPLRLLATYKVPKYCHRILRIGPDLLALATTGRKTVAVFSARERALRSRLPMPSPELHLDVGGGDLLLLSFWEQRARRFLADLRPGPWLPLPVGVTPLVSRGVIFFVPGERRMAENVTPPNPEVTSVYSLGRVAVFSPSSWDVLSEGPPIRGLQRLVFADGSNRIVGLTEREVLLIDPGRLQVLARYDTGEQIAAAAQVGSSALAFHARSGVTDECRIVEWGVA